MEVIVIDSLAYEKLKQEPFEFIAFKLEENYLRAKMQSAEFDWIDVPHGHEAFENPEKQTPANEKCRRHSFYAKQE